MHYLQLLGLRNKKERDLDFLPKDIIILFQSCHLEKKKIIQCHPGLNAINTFLHGEKVKDFMRGCRLIGVVILYFWSRILLLL